ncbi:DUF389 domain-containing protein [Flavobacterium cerinum]|uniref:DUF389 domain-containing protein n=1 Tax=Flavobacterium cerinum TaxID=2502784 RepID=A0ABY5IQE6_9FLAO|nr:DUF389 domain-containing protein [Flavobacterium cerinum]UUC45010.1 DUF389 domain-containing protein [Flavobacterium cerinum]
MVKRILEYLNLEKEVDDFDKIHENIEKDVIFKGTNLWILVFAIFVASIGLNMNSTAVIIGAMLISPLMGPINGMGYSLATYNFLLFRKAFKNFGFAVIASLIASTLYFTISPVSTAHSELLARTSPTIYDVLIALFGGLAGIVAMSSKQKGNVIPGVAIATALMPPLCTAGYGLATFNLTYFFGAFYLFTINTVFIALSSVLVSQLLKFPIRTLVNEEQKKKVNRWVSFVILITIIPSIYFGYVLVKNERFTTQAEQFVKSVSFYDGNYLLKNEIDANKRKITLMYAGNALTDKTKKNILNKAIDFQIDSSGVAIQKGLAFDEINNNNLSKVESLQSELNRMQLLLKEGKRKQDSINARIEIGKQLLAEIKPLYPGITSCSFSETAIFGGAEPEKTAIVTFSAEKNALKPNDKEKISEWIKSRVQNEKTKVYFESEHITKKER